MIDRSTISRIMDAADIVDVVKEFVTLRKAGVNYKGLCPFHDEKTPSFVVSPSKQLCKCFSCGKGGNVVHFVMEHEQMTYPEALKWLARKYGIEVREKEETEEEKREASTRESMFVLNEWARDYFCNMLHNHADGIAIGMAYFRQRGFRDDIIRKFQLGFSLPARDAIAQAALAKGFNPEYLEKTGLCYRTDDGKLLDRYHGRVIFPVHTISGKVVAFGGRILGNDKKLAKYVNSPESDIYSKSHELYGLYLSKHAIVKHNRCYLVEGYTDVISMHQSGIENVVASSGTSLTEGQIRLLHRFTSNITVLYDGDSAGIKASLRGIDMLLAEGLNIKVLLLPDGDDPDSFARKHNAAEYQAYIDSHQVDFIKFKTDLLLEDCGNDPVKKAELIQSIVQSIAVVPDSIVRQMYAKECATALNVSEQLITNEIAKKRASSRKQEEQQQQQGQEQQEQQPEPEKTAAEMNLLSSKEQQEEELLANVLIRYGNLIVFANELEDGSQQPVNVVDYITEELKADGLEFRVPIFRKVLQEAQYISAHPETPALQFFLSHPDAEISQLAGRLGEDKYVLSKSQAQACQPDEQRLHELVPRLLHDFKHSIVKAEMTRILQQLQQAQATQMAPEEYLELMKRYKQLSDIEKQFAKILGEQVIIIN